MIGECGILLLGGCGVISILNAWLEWCIHLFHIVVQNGHVTLVGKVPTIAERIELQRLVSHTDGVLRVNNELSSLQLRRS